MRHGRTSVVDFGSRILVSVIGFASTVVLTQTLGQDRYGTYVVGLSIVAWVLVVATLGIPDAIRKRVSETDDGNYIVSGAAVQFVLYAGVATIVWLVRSRVNAFIGADVANLVVVLLGARIALGVVQSILKGQHLVHVASLLSPVEQTARSIVQIGLVVAGFGVVGALTGYAAGAVVAALVGLYFVDTPSDRPSRREFNRIRSYAQLSWLGTVKSRAFLSMDTIVLALFVSNALVGIYEVAWNVATLFAIFGASIRETLFPDISRISSESDDRTRIADLLWQALAYSGLLTIPGLVGTVLVGDTILTVYGPGFDKGYYILIILAVARLVHGYMEQFVSVIDAVDRPELTMYVNAAFIGTNLPLNVLLTWQYGWYGAAVTTMLSVVVGLALSYRYAGQLAPVQVPISEVAKQVAAAGVMAVVVLIGRLLVGESLPIVIALVGVGASVYFLVLLRLSREFRTTVRDNLPLSVPLS